MTAKYRKVYFSLSRPTTPVLYKIYHIKLNFKSFSSIKENKFE